MGTNLENLERFYFPDASQISAMVGNHSRQMKTHICTVGDIGVHQRWISLITNPLNCWALVALSQINTASRENLRKTSGEYLIYWQNLGWSGKSKIPNGLGFSRHMKTRLKNIKASLLQSVLKISLCTVWQCNIYTLDGISLANFVSLEFKCFSWLHLH